MRRVVVTGLGTLTPLGIGVDASWDALLQGRCGICPVTRFDASAFGSRIAGEVKDFDPSTVLPPKEARRFERFIAFAAFCAKEAFADAQLGVAPEEEAHRYGVVVGSGIGGLELLCKNYVACMERGPRRVTPFLVPGGVISMAAGELSILFNLKGPGLTTASACSSGLHAIGEAAWMIQRDDADVMIAGGSESVIFENTFAGFDIIHALSRANENPERASRPFDRDRDGFVLGEGAGFLVLEEYEHAKRRGARIYAELAGYGLTADAFHITSPSVDGPVRAMKDALRRAGLKPEEIDHLNAHGTSTPIGDVNEAKAIRAVFGEHAEKLVVTSTKGATGHALGASGGIESVFSVKSLYHGIVPPTINLENQDSECAIRVCANKPMTLPMKAVMKNSFGFGGANASLVFKYVAA